VIVGEDSSVQRMRENRTRIAIMACILRKPQMPTRKTQIMYGCALSRRRAACLLGVLRFNDMIEGDEESRIYQTTKKGYEFLSYYNRLSQLPQTEEMETPWSRSGSLVVGSIFRNRYSTRQK